jgi:hypothetical protein
MVAEAAFSATGGSAGAGCVFSTGVAGMGEVVWAKANPAPLSSVANDPRKPFFMVTPSSAE